jgi:hypothetical protein
MPDRNDDPIGIPNGTRLFRRIDPTKTVFDKDRKERRPTSQNFQNSKDATPMSVFAENVAVEHGESPIDFLKGVWSGWCLVAVPTSWMRENGQKVYLDQDVQDPNDWHPSHTAVAGLKDPKTRKRLAEGYEWIVPPLNRYDSD